MAHSGQTIENPITHERMVFRKTARDTAGALLEIDMFVGRGGFVAAEHIHPEQEERLIVRKGLIRFRLQGQERIYRAGETIVVPPGSAHQWWQQGDEELHVVLEFRPALNFDEFLETVFGLARDGKTNSTGGVNLFQAAALFGGPFRGLIYLARPPVWVQKYLFTALAPVGRLLGYRNWYPEYLGKSGGN
jgi:quercetin dioxygenase-like cupin family protein